MHLRDVETAAQAASIASFIAARTVRADNLSCPLLVVWWDYVRYCERWGFTKAQAYDFVDCILSLDGIRLIEGGRGRLKRCIVGIGVMPITKDM
jgi:hypothetical protein